MKKSLLVLFVCCSLHNCEDIIGVPDISEQVVTILAPAENSVLMNTNVNFTWNAVEDAENYKLQIAMPSFEASTQIVLDTTISVTNFNKTLETGTYQWRVKAQNSGFETAYTTQSFSIEE